MASNIQNQKKLLTAEEREKEAHNKLQQCVKQYNNPELRLSCYNDACTELEYGGYAGSVAAPPDGFCTRPIIANSGTQRHWFGAGSVGFK